MPKPYLGHSVALQINMLIKPLGQWEDGELVIDDPLSPVVTRIES